MLCDQILILFFLKIHNSMRKLVVARLIIVGLVYSGQ